MRWTLQLLLLRIAEHSHIVTQLAAGDLHAILFAIAVLVRIS